MFTSMLNGFAAGVNIFENAILDLSAGIAGAAIGAAIGVVQGLIVAFDSDQCCPDELSCHRVLGVSLKFTDCNHIAEYTAFGFGADDVTLGWANSGGTPTTATTPTSAPRLTITQTSPSIPVSTGISSVCSNGTINVPPAPFIRNLADLVKDVYGVGILGPTITSGEEETPRTYFASGIVPARYEVLTWFATNGEVVQSNAANAKILWDNSKRKARFLCGFGTFAPKDGLKPFN